ncbi:MAG: ABC transporter permease [Bryobacteraceae bacterium]
MSALNRLHWRRQLTAILKAELRKNFITKRGFWIYMLALAPVAIVWLHSIIALRESGNSHSLSNDTKALAIIFQLFYLRLLVFFGCVGIFTYLFRGEVLEKSLHYYFLAPVRRELLLTGKFLAGFITASFFFSVSVLLTFAGMYAHYGSGQIREFLFDAGGLQHLFSYLVITILGCLGYGTLFLAAGLVFRNPILPAAGLLIWESLNLFLPVWLKRLSVFYYLKGLCPVDIPARGPAALLAVVSEPEPAWMAVLGLLAFSTAVFWFAVRRLRRMEISYSAD